MDGIVHSRILREGVVVAEDIALDQVGGWLAEPGTVAWIDLCEPDAEELRELAAALDLHPLAVDDAIGPHQRAKVDHYDTHEFLTAHALSFDPVSGRLLETEVDLFINHRWLVTVRKNDLFDPALVTRHWDRGGERAHHGVGFLLHGLLDVIVDGYLDVVEYVEDAVEDVSDSIVEERPLTSAEQRHWFQVRRSLGRFRRLSAPLTDAVAALTRHERVVIDEELVPYFQDLHDHLLRATEACDTLRDLAAMIVEADLALRDLRQNQVMKQVTSWAAIIAVPTLVTGYYGMNVPFPGEGEPWGMATATALSAGAALVLFRVFRRRSWL
jgi:magnesium transporter